MIERRRALPLVAVFALTLAGCGGITEGLTERAIESLSDEVKDIDVDSDAGRVRIETADGTLTIGGGSIPEGITLAPPPGGEVVSSLEAPTVAQVMVLFPGGDFEAIVAFMEGQVRDDWERSSFTSQVGDDTQRNVSWSGEGGLVSIASCEDDRGPFSGVCVTILEGSDG
jgi:hypothetical protein